MSGAKTDILFTLAENAGRTHGEWPNYLAYGFDDSDVAPGISKFDGYFVAIACAPRTIMVSVWTPGICGGEAHSPRLGNDKR